MNPPQLIDDDKACPDEQHETAQETQNPDLHPKEDLTHGDEGVDDPQPNSDPP